MRTVVHTKVFRLRLADSTGAGHCRTFLSQLSASFVPSETCSQKAASRCVLSRHAMLTYAAACAARSQRQSDLGLPSDAPPVLPVDTLAAAQPRAIIHRADRMQGIGISMAGFQLAFQLAERSNRSLYTDWEMFLVGFEGIEEPPEALESADSQVGEAWTWEREGHEKQAPGTAARLAAADKPTVVELSGDDLSVAQVRDAWRAGGAPRSAAEEEQVFEDLNRHRLLERYTPNKYVRENLAALGSHERVVHIRVGDGGGPEGEGPCHVEDSRINLSAGMAALRSARRIAPLLPQAWRRRI